MHKAPNGFWYRAVVLDVKEYFKIPLLKPILEYTIEYLDWDLKCRHVSGLNLRHYHYDFVASRVHPRKRRSDGKLMRTFFWSFLIKKIIFFIF